MKKKNFLSIKNQIMKLVITYMWVTHTNPFIIYFCFFIYLCYV